MVTGAKRLANISGIGKVTSILKKIVYPVGSVTNAIGAILMMGMMLFVTLDVILRSTFNITVLGTVVYESVGFMLVVLVFLALGYCQMKKAHVNIDMIIIHLPIRAQRVINSILLFISAVFFILLTWQSVLRAFSLRDSGTISSALNIPTYPFLFVVAFGTALLALILIINFMETITGESEK